MQPLLSIQTVNIALEWNVNKASLQNQGAKPQVNVTRNRGRSEIRTEPARVNMDSFESRASMGLKSARRSIQDYGSMSRSIGLEAVQTIAENGNQMVDSRGKGEPIADIVMARANPTYQTTISYIPSVGPQISVEGGDISFDFTKDELVFEWNVPHRPQFDYIPGQISFSVSQYPEVIIEYIGGPIYVPPSADPDFVPPLVLDATA